MKRNRSWFCWILVSTFGYFGQTVSSAQSAPPADQANAMQEIVVTARKQSESVQAIPESITVISGSAIALSHLTKLDDLNSSVTNLNITQRADNTPDVVLRGVGTFGVVQGVGFYVNDLQQFDGQTVRPNDIERIEVLKGPQGTLFGGSNIGGAIKYVTKLPSETPTGEATVEYGGFHDRTVDAAISGPLMSDKFLGRLSLFNETTDGYLFDPIFGRNIGKSKETGGRLTLEYRGEQTNITFFLTGDHINTEDMNLYATPPDDQTYLRGYLGGVDGTIPFFRRDIYSPSLQVTHDFGDVQFTSLSSYFHSSIDSIGNLDKGGLPTLGVALGDPTVPCADCKAFANYPQTFGKSVWSQELRLASNGGLPFKWLVGTFVQEINSTTVQIQNFGAAPVIGSPVGVVPLLFLDSSAANRHINRDYALFGNGSYDLGKWTLEAGLRIAGFDNTMTETTPGCDPCYGKVNEVDVLPKGSINYHFSEDVMGYFTVARGDEEGDLVDNPGAVNSVQPLKTEFALSYEAGLKSQLFDRRLTLNLAGFYIDYKDRIFEIGKFTGGGIFLFEQNVGSSKNYGYELEAIVRPTPELNVTAGWGATEAKFGPAVFADGFGNSVNANGKSAPFTPAYQGTLAVDWRHHLSDEVVLGSRVDTRFIGRSFWDPAGCSALAPGCPSEGFRVQQRPYQVVDLGAFLDVGTHWSVGANVKNLFDAEYNTQYSPATELASPFNIARINRPRQWLISVTARF